MILCLLIALVALVMCIFMVQTLKAVERRLVDLHKQLGRLQGEVASAEAKIKALSAAQAHRGSGVEQLLGVATGFLGAGKWGTLSKLALLGYNQYKGRRKNGSAKALPQSSGTHGEQNG